nr:hypothetical protein [Brevibacillus laterosporus]
MPAKNLKKQAFLALNNLIMQKKFAQIIFKQFLKPKYFAPHCIYDRMTTQIDENTE